MSLTLYAEPEARTECWRHCPGCDSCVPTRNDWINHKHLQTDEHLGWDITVLDPNTYRRSILLVGLRTWTVDGQRQVALVVDTLLRVANSHPYLFV